jgi:uncharacterized protein
MVVRSSVPAGAPCWVDLQTSDPAKAREFYPRVLGWEALEASPEFGGYFMFTRNGVPVAGCMPADAQAPVTDVWSVYLNTADAAGTLAAAAGHGGQIAVPAMPVADLGTMGFLLGPDGAAIGVWQPGTFTGSGLLAEHGAPAWFELLTRDYERSVRFYQDVFGWQTRVLSDAADFRMTVQADPEHAGQGDPLSGIMDAADWLPAGVPAHWAVYFGVDDADVALAAVTDAGGAILRPAADTPYGRVGQVRDVTGAVFSLVAPIQN